MRALVRFALFAPLALALVACSGDTSSSDPSAAPPPNPPTTAPEAAPAPAAAPDAATLDTATLRERAGAALAENRLYSPAGDNAVEDYLALRDREPGDAAVDVALVDLAPYVMIGAEQATTAENFAEAARLIDLLVRMDAEAPAVPRLREALATAETLAAQRDAEAAAEAERLAAEAERPQATATAATTAAPPVAAPSAPTPTPPEAAPPSPASTRPPVAAPPPAPAPTVTAAPAASRPTAPPRPAEAPARALLQRVAPRFPEAAARRRLEGEVEVRVRIRADGSVEEVSVLRADPPGVFDREAVLAVRRWRYAPADAPSEARAVLQFRSP